MSDTASVGAETVAAAEDIADGVAKAARRVVEDLPDASDARRLVQTSAEAAARMGLTLREDGLKELTASLRMAATRQPALFVGCGVLAGFLLAQLLPSSR